jgi:hypothetical protein
VDLNQGRFLSCPSVPVSDQDGNRFLQCEDVFQIRERCQGIKKSLLDGSRIAEHIPEAVGQELFENRETTSIPIHGCSLQMDDKRVRL